MAMTSESRSPVEPDLRSLLVGELHAAAQAARDAADTAERDPATAVHAFRKALRRARAIVALTRDALPRADRRAAVRALRDERRALGPARDRAVAPEAFDALGLDEPARASARTVVDAAAAAGPAEVPLAQALADGAARAVARIELVEAALPAAIEWSTVADSIVRVYRDARRARRDAKHGKRAFHAWRRRTKELRYQLGVVVHHAPQLAALVHDIDGVAGAQGPAVDLIMLRGLVRDHGDAVDADARRHLRTAIDTQLATLAKAARRAGRDAFHATPAALARHLVGRGDAGS